MQDLTAAVTDDNSLGLYRFEDGDTLVVIPSGEGFAVQIKGLSVKFPMRE